MIAREGRERIALSKSALSDRIGISRQMIAEIEGGTANPTLDSVVQLLDGLGLEVEITVRGPVVLDGPPTSDVVHAICSAFVQRRLEAAGWKTAREVRIDSGRYLGWIDLLAFHQATGYLLVIEIKTRIEDIGSIERTMDWYRREAIGAARRLGWRPNSVTSWLLALATDEVETRLRENRAAVDAAFPGRASEMSATIAEPGVLRHARCVALIDPRSRRRVWLLRTRLDGRRSAAPYRGYADFVATVRRPTPGGRR